MNKCWWTNKTSNERSFVYRPPAWRRWRNVKTTLKDTTTADSHENVALKSEFKFFSVSIVIIPTRLLCQMQANSSGAEFLSTISKFMKRMNFVIACLRPSQNVKLRIFTGSRAVDGKEM